MNARTGNETNKKLKDILNDYLAELDKLSLEYETACADPESNDWYLHFLETQMERLESLAYLYMAMVSNNQRKQ